MTDDLAGLVMKAAATEVLYGEAAQIDQEMHRLLAEMEHAPASECHGILLQRFLDLLQRRGEVAKKALIMGEKDFGATFPALTWPLSSQGQIEQEQFEQGQFDTSPSASIRAFSSEGSVVSAAAKVRTPTNKRPACDAGNRAMSRLNRPAGTSAGLAQDSCRDDKQVRRIEVPEGSAPSEAAQLLQRVGAHGDQWRSDHGVVPSGGAAIGFAGT